MANTPISVRLSAENRDWLELQARKDDRSLNYMINKLLDGVRGSGRKPRKGPHDL